jgi:hypothetical protein
MQIYNYNSTIFTAKKLPAEKSLKTVATKLKSDTFSNKENLYNDIEKYLKKDISKEEYFKFLIEKIKNNSYYVSDRVEEKYVNDMLTTLDLVVNTKKIPDEYLKRKMENLLKYKNSQ